MSTPANQVQSYITSSPPKSPRAADFSNMVFQPGVASNSPARDLAGRWISSNRVRWHKGLPEKIGGWAVVPLVPPGSSTPIQYVGTCRAACDWASLDSNYWVAFATECKLYLINNATLYDITPNRQTSNLANAFSTTNTSPLVTITDPNNFANPGDHIEIVGTVTIGGLSLSGDYNIANIIDPSNYQINAGANATSTVTNGGGSATVEYQLSCGLAINGFLYGYGAGEYGEGEYGEPSSTGGVPAKMRTWSLSNWGQDLVASYVGGELYWWQWTSGPTSQAAIVSSAPTAIQRILVNADAQFLIAVGCSDVDGNADPMNVRWCSEGDLTDWVPVVLPVANTAGGQRLNFGSKMVAAIQSRQQNLLWSDTQLYQMQFLGEPDFFGFNELGKCYLVGPNAAIDVNGVVYMMCFDQFMVYDGTLRTLDCEMWETVFGTSANPTGYMGAGSVGFDRTQAEMVYCASFMLKNEVTWFYPANDGSDTMQYITYNYELNCWYGGTMPRTCYHDVTNALTGSIQYPYAFNGGYLYNHEVGHDEVEAGGTNPMIYYMQSWDIGAQTDRPVLINSVIPEWQRLRNGCQFSYLWKEYPQDSAYNQVGPFILTPDASKYDARCGGSQIGLLIEQANVPGLTGSAGLLLHCDGAAGSTAFPDSSGNNLAPTLYGVGPTVETSNVVFGTGAMSMSVNAGVGYPLIPGGVIDFTPNGTDWTLEFRVNGGAQTNGEGWIVSLYGAPGTTLYLYVIYNTSGGAGLGEINVSFPGGSLTSTNTVIDNVWTAVAIVKHGSTATIYLNGVANVAGGVSSHSSIPSASLLSFGASSYVGASGFSGLIDEFRLTLSALYTANYTPANAPFSSNGTVPLGQDFRMGTWQSQATPHGKRIGTGSMGSPINTNNP